MSIGVLDRKKLWALSRNECAFPSCSQRLVGDLPETDQPSGVTVVGEEAHIRSGRPAGPRYDADYDPLLIDSYENLILLCPTHHTMVDKDNGRGYSVAQLIKIRRGHEQAAARGERLQRACSAYLADQWIKDNKVLFEAVELNGPSVESMFVDVPIAARTGTSAGEIVAAIHEAAPGDLEARDPDGALEVAGGAQVLLHPRWTGNALIQGGPGQGKSTLLQYVCQFHRSRLVNGKDENYTGPSTGLTKLTSVARLPIRVDLRRFAAWLKEYEKTSAKRIKKNHPKQASLGPADPLAAYLAQHIRDNSGEAFGPEDLATLLAERSVLLAFDGLDEIASIKDREKASDILVTSIPRLQSYALDLVVFVATRPGATDSTRWADANFDLLTLRPLSLGLKVQYLDKWCTQANVSVERAADLQTKLIDNQSVPHVRELGANPMQLAILLHLLHRRGLLPQQRTQLYRDYIQTFLDREEQGKEPLLSSHRQVIVEIHAFLAWYLQSRAENEDNTTGSLSRHELVELVRAHLADSTEGSKFADQLIAALTTRVLCLVERQPGFFEFEVQSLREYFAAFHIFEESPPRGATNSRDDCLSALIERPYWSNVMRFMVGMLSKGEVKSLIDNLRSRQHDGDCRLDPYLRWVAAQLLDDRIYENQSDAQIARVVDFILEEQGVAYSEAGLLDGAGLPLVLGEQAGARQVLEHVKARLSGGSDEATQAQLADLALRHSAPDAGIADWAWTQVAESPTSAELDLLARLGAFAGLDTQKSNQLRNALRSESGERAVELLARGRYDGDDPDLMMRVLLAVVDGAGDTVDLRWFKGIESPLRTVVSLGRLAPLFDLPALTNGVAASARQRRARQRRRNGQVVHAGPQQLLTAWQAADTALWHPDSGETEIKALINTLRDISPDSWLARVVTTYAAPTFDLSLGAEASLAIDNGWRAHASWTFEAANHPNNLDWWRSHPSPDDGLALRHWLLGAACLAGTRVILEMLPTLDEGVARLSKQHYQSLQVATRLMSRRPTTHGLNLRDALRRNTVTMSARTAALLTWRSDDDANAYLRPLILEKSLPVTELTPPAGVLRESLAKSDSTLKASDLQGAGSHFPAGTLHHLPPRVSLTDSRTVLKNPAEWPADLVVLAARKISQHRTQVLPALAEVARDDRWFQDG